MFRRTISILLFVCLFTNVFSQDYVVNGFVKDRKTNEPIIGAAVYVIGTDIGTATDTEGSFSLNLSKRYVNIKVAFIGYIDTLMSLKLTGDSTLSVFLKSNTDIDEVEIEDDEIFWNPNDHSLKGDIRLINAKLSESKSEISEDDIVIQKSIRKVEIQPISDVYLRNGQGYNQNLIFIDGARVFNSSSVFDFIPIVTDESVRTYHYFYGNYPARYGEHMSSVLDVTTTEGNMQDYSGSFYLDLMKAAVRFEGPVIKDKSSLFISARKTFLNYPYTELFSADLSSDNLYWAKPAYFDVNVKYTHKLTENDKLSFHLFNNNNKLKTEVQDSYEDSPEFSYNHLTEQVFSNFLSSINYEHVFAPDLVFNAGVNYSHYKMKESISGDSLGLLNDDYTFINRYNSEYNSTNGDIALKLKLNWNPNSNHTIKFGGNIINHRFKPAKAELAINDFEHSYSLDTTWEALSLNAQEFILYAEDNIKLSDDFTIHGGVHFSIFNNKGVSFYSVQPRLYADYKILKNVSLNISYANYKQYIHYLSNYANGLSSDLFLPSGGEINPVNTHRFAAGTSLELPFDIFIKADAFYDLSANVYTYKEGFGFFDFLGETIMPGMNLYNRIENGQSDSYGIRVLFNKDINNLRIAAGHTISNSIRKFDNISYGETYQYRYNNRHDFKLQMKYIFSENFHVFVNWIYRSGNYISPVKQSYIPYNYETASLGQTNSPEEVYGTDDELYQSLGFRNDYQLPVTHRLDLGANYVIEKHSIGIQIYNVYNRRNPDYVGLNNSVLTNSTEDHMVVHSILPFFPGLSYSYKF